MKELKKMQQLNDVLYPTRVTCNKCAETIWDSATAMRSEGGLPVIWDTSYLEVKQEWGYGTSLDGEFHSFDLCLACYDGLVKTFKIPISVTQTV